MTRENSSVFFHEKSGQYIPRFIYPVEWPNYFNTPTLYELENMIDYLIASGYSVIFPYDDSPRRPSRRMINVQALLQLLEASY